MIDIKLIRQHRDEIEKKLKTKDPSADLSTVVELDKQIREIKTRVEHLKATRNEASQTIGTLKREGKDTTKILHDVAQYADEIHALDQKLGPLEQEFINAIARLPNIPMDDIKVAESPQDNVLIKEVGKKPTFDFPFLNHMQLNDKLNLFDFKRGAKIAGAGWPIYRGMGARLEWALINYMISIHIKKWLRAVDATRCGTSRNDVQLGPTAKI